MTMTSISQKIKILGLVPLLSFLLFPLASRAQESVAFSVSPTIYDMTANPGQIWQSTVRIINPNTFPLTLSVTPNDFIPKDEDGIPQFIPLDDQSLEKKTLGEWIETEKEIVIGAEQTLELPFKISVPEGATPGGHYAALMISTEPAENIKANGQVQTSQVISALVFLRVTGDITESSSIRSFRTADYFLSKPETRFEIRVENKGNVHLQPQGEIKIYNMWGRERGTIPINQQTLLGNVLPQSVRKFSFEWASEWSVTDIGRYTAKATLAYGTKDRQFISADTAFWIIPWKIILLFLVVVGSLVATISWAIKLYVRHVLALAGVTPADLRASPAPGNVKEKPVKKNLSVADITAPIGISILDLRSKLKKNRGPWTDSLVIYKDFVKTYYKFFVGVGAVLALLLIAAWFVLGGLTTERSYEITDPISGAVIAGDVAKLELENGHGTTITLVNRTADENVLKSVSERAIATGFIVATSTSETGAPEEKTVIVYNPEVSEEALLLSRLFNNALLSAFTSTATTSEKIIVYVGKDAISSP